MEIENQNDKTYVLLIKCLSGEASREENIQAAEWINASEDNRKFYNTLRDSWIACSIDKPVDASSLNTIWEKIKSNSIDMPVGGAKSLNFYIRYAAIALIFMTLGGLIYYFVSPKNTSARELAYTVEAPVGARAKITLPDGTLVNLNAGSKLSYTSMYNFTERSVSLTGEAYFDVAADKSKPFRVSTSSISVFALGTSFNVKAYPQDDEVETTLVEGSVKIEDAKKKEHLLKPNEKFTFSKADQSSTISELRSEASKNLSEKRAESVNKKIESVESITSWKDNKLIFENEPLAEMASKMRRWYGVDIYLKSVDSLNAKYSGKFEYNETIYQVLDILSRTTPIQYITKDHKIFISGKN